MKIKIKGQINERYMMKKNYKLFLKQNLRYKHFKDLVGSYVELENRLKRTQENLNFISQ